MLKATIIVCTYNRPQELENCLRSILCQTRLPLEVIVVDDGHLPGFPLAGLYATLGIRSRFHRKDKPGLTASRNAGVAMAEGDVILFLDDDVVLFPNYVEEILKIFENDADGKIGAVGGYEAQILGGPSFSRRLRNLYDAMFCISGFRDGRVLWSGFCTEYGANGDAERGVRPVEHLVGACFSFRREVFDYFSFSEDYQGYGLGEDKDFSYQVSKRYGVVVNGQALLFHFESPKNRYDKGRMGREFVLARHRFFVERAKRHGWQWFFFWYAIFGYTLFRAMVMVLTLRGGEWARMKGILGAVRDIMRGGPG